MPRIRQNEEKYAMQDFVKEIRKQGIEYGCESQEEFGKKWGVSQKTAGNYLNDPDRIKLGTLRTIVKTMKINPFSVLKVLGYSTQDIRKFAKEYVQ